MHPRTAITMTKIKSTAPARLAWVQRSLRRSSLPVSRFAMGTLYETRPSLNSPRNLLETRPHDGWMHERKAHRIVRRPMLFPQRGGAHRDDYWGRIRSVSSQGRLNTDVVAGSMPTEFFNKFSTVSFVITVEPVEKRSTCHARHPKGFRLELDVSHKPPSLLRHGSRSKTA